MNNSQEIRKLDEKTLKELYKQHFRGLCYFAWQYVKDNDVAEEIVQDAFVNLWEKRENIDLSKSVKSYLATTVYNRSLNWLRDNKKFNKDLLALENIPTDCFEAVDETMEADETAKKVEEAIQQLPEKCREVFLLNRFENMKYKQIAEHLQISVKTVEAQMSKALSFLRSKLLGILILGLLVLTSKFFQK